MQNNDIETIEQLYEVCSKMEKTTKLGYLAGQWIRFNSIAKQMIRTIQLRGGYMTNEERTQSQQLFNILDAIREESSKAARDIANEGINGLIKMVLGG